jgi:hypothetical protein
MQDQVEDALAMDSGDHSESHSLVNAPEERHALVCE